MENSVTRRSALGLLPAFGMAARAFAAEVTGPTLRLAPIGAARRLSDRYVGANVEPVLDFIAAYVLSHSKDTGLLQSKHGSFMEDSVKIHMLKQMNLAYTRFPAGSLANLYDWRTGRLLRKMPPDSAKYEEFWSQVSKAIDTNLPGGLHYPQYLRFSNKIGAEPIFVPNLETDTAESQAAWMKELAAKGIAPHHVELGNEYYNGLGGDPRSVARWKDAPTQLAITKPYVDAMRPYLPKDVKFAVPVSDDDFMAWPDLDDPLQHRWTYWNQGMTSKPWFDGVTVHPYCRVANLLPSVTEAPSTQADARVILNALLAHYDEGMEAALGRIAARLPGKELWVDEWNPRTGDVRIYSGAPVVVTESIELQVLARGFFAMLRQPAVTMSLRYAVSFASSKAVLMFLDDGNGGYVPTAIAAALGWFAKAINGGALYQRMVEPNALRISGGGRLPESYAAIEGAHFVHMTGSTTLIQNASATTRQLALDSAMPPSKIEAMSLPILADQSQVPAPIQEIAADTTIVLPPYSLTRLVLTT